MMHCLPYGPNVYGVLLLALCVIFLVIGIAVGILIATDPKPKELK